MLPYCVTKQSPVTCPLFCLPSPAIMQFYELGACFWEVSTMKRCMNGNSAKSTKKEARVLSWPSLSSYWLSRIIPWLWLVGRPYPVSVIGWVEASAAVYWQSPLSLHHLLPALFLSVLPSERSKGTSWLLGPMSHFLNAISSCDLVHFSTLSISRNNESSIDTIMFSIKHLCNLDMRSGRVIKFAISIFLRISRNFGWESCETNLLRRTVGAAFYGLWRLWNQVDNRLHALRDTVGGCILRHLVNTGTNLVNLCYSTDDSVGRRR